MKNTDIREFIAQIDRGAPLDLAEQKRLLEALLRANNRIISYRKEFGELPTANKTPWPQLTAVTQRS